MGKYTLFAMTTPKKGVCKVGMTQKVCTYENGVWRTDKASGISHINAVVVDSSGATWAVGELGDVFCMRDGEKTKKYTIEDAGKGPNKFGTVVDAAIIQDTIYICGNGQQLYKQSGDGFTRFDEGIRPEYGQHRYNWLSVIAGLSEDTLHAVGNRGRIWNYDGTSWNVNAPIEENLQAITALADGTFCVAGQNGTVIKGFRDK